MKNEIVKPIVLKSGGKHLANIYFLLDVFEYPRLNDIDSRVKFVFELSARLPSAKFSFFQKALRKKSAFKVVFDFIFGDSESFKKLKFDKKKIVQTIRQSLEVCHNLIPTSVIEVAVFPSFSRIGRDGGVSGMSVRKNSLNLFINPNYRDLDIDLKSTICHEYFHGINVDSHDQIPPVAIQLVHEGLASYFSEDASRYRDPKVFLSAEAAWETIASLYPKLHRVNRQLSDELFLYGSPFGKKKKRRLLGYSLGFWLVYPFIKSTGLSWKELALFDPEEIYWMSIGLIFGLRLTLKRR